MSAREELEMRVTAGLLGELAPAEAAALETVLQADPKLRALRERLRPAVELLREASAAPEPAAPVEGLQLSPGKRERLRRHWRGEAGSEGTPAPGAGVQSAPAAHGEPASAPPRRAAVSGGGWRSWAPLALAAALIAFLGSVVFLTPKVTLQKSGRATRDLPKTQSEGSAWDDRKPAAAGADSDVNVVMAPTVSPPSEPAAAAMGQDSKDRMASNMAGPQVEAITSRPTLAVTSGERQPLPGASMGSAAVQEQRGYHFYYDAAAAPGAAALADLAGTAPAPAHALENQQSIFFSGGTSGTSPTTNSADFPFARSDGPTAGKPISSSLRSGNLAISQNAIDALLFGVAGASTLAPSTGALSGVFTAEKKEGGKPGAVAAEPAQALATPTPARPAGIAKALTGPPLPDLGSGARERKGVKVPAPAAAPAPGSEPLLLGKLKIGNQYSTLDQDADSGASRNQIVLPDGDRSSGSSGIPGATPDGSPPAQDTRTSPSFNFGRGFSSLAELNQVAAAEGFEGSVPAGHGSVLPQNKADHGALSLNGLNLYNGSTTVTGGTVLSKGIVLPDPLRDRAAGEKTEALKKAEKPAEALVTERITEAHQYLETGRTDLAFKRTEQVLSADPGNADARQLQEEIRKKRTESGLEGNDRNRSTLLWQLEKKWDLPVRRFGEAAATPAPPAAPAKPGGDPSEVYLQAYQAGQAAEKLEAQRSPAEARSKYQEANDALASIETAHPEWNHSIVGFRRKRVQEALQRLGPDPGLLPATPAPSAPVKTEAAPPAPAAAPPATPQPEVQTAANAFSTFSLNVSDVSFKLAAASLEKGTLPEPAAIRSEEFINALDYRDPEPAAGAPLAFASDRGRDPFAQNRDFLRFSIKTAAAGRAAGRPLNLVLLLDASGSMERADRVAIVREAMRVLAAQLQPQDKLSVITFARTPRLRADGVSGGEAGEVLAHVGEFTPEGGTDLAAALALGYETALRHFTAGSSSRVVLLTDGAANLGEVDAGALRKTVEAHRLQGVALDCFGIGWEGYNDDLLEELTRHGDGRYGFLNTPAEAAEGFAGQLAGALRVAASDVKAQVEWNPQRVTAWRQVGYAKHQLTAEQFRDNTVDAAEIGAAESGNAIYVVEVNGQGTGDLGTVRVRCKVPGTALYREQAWPVPYTGHAPALEEAAPALRLAAVAAAFSEQLAGSPYAAEVTSDRLLSVLGGVPARYGSDPRPQQLEAMIRQAKSLSGH